jgi:hypothetical protein
LEQEEQRIPPLDGKVLHLVQHDGIVLGAKPIDALQKQVRNGLLKEGLTDLRRMILGDIDPSFGSEVPDQRVVTKDIESLTITKLFAYKICQTLVETDVKHSQSIVLGETASFLHC